MGEHLPYQQLIDGGLGKLAFPNRRFAFISCDSNNKNGLPWKVSESGTTVLEREFNRYGETNREAYTEGSADAFAWEVTERDEAGRIKTKTETAGGTGMTYVYGYEIWAA